MKLSIVLSLQPAQFQAATFKGDLETNLAQIAALGYDGVELAIRDPKLVDLDNLEQLIKERGLSVPAIGTGQAWGEEGLSFTDPDPGVRKAAIERIISHIPGAVRFQAIIIIGLIRGVVKPGVDQAQAMDWLVDALHECCVAAHPLGIRLALEPINRYETNLINTVAEGLELIERVADYGIRDNRKTETPAHDARGVPRFDFTRVGALQSATPRDAVSDRHCAPELSKNEGYGLVEPGGNFGLLLDTFHMNIEEADITGSIRAGGDRIFHFHVADSNRLPPGAGHLDFKAILSALKATGYQGWVSGEFLPKPDAVTSARQAITCLNQIQD
jgi:sugar phosphate isomerase/epimerase